jgi:hypothetical protein
VRNSVSLHNLLHDFSGKKDRIEAFPPRPFPFIDMTDIIQAGQSCPAAIAVIKNRLPFPAPLDMNPLTDFRKDKTSRQEHIP